MRTAKFLGIAVALVLALTLAAFVVVAGVQELNYDSFNNATNISYDSLNRVLVKNFTSGYNNYTYDVDYLGTLTNVSFANGSVSYTYDDRLRVIEEVRVIDGIRFAKILDYDSADRLVRQVVNPGTAVGYVHGSGGSVDKIVGFVNATR